MRKLLLAGVLLNSISVMASNSQLPDFEEVKRGFLSTDLTIDRNSEAGEAFGGAARVDWKREGIKDDEAGLLKAMQLGHAFAAHILFREYGAQKPGYRELLLMTTLKKLQHGFTHGLRDDMSKLGHLFLYEQQNSLKSLLEKTGKLLKETEDSLKERDAEFIRLFPHYDEEKMVAMAEQQVHSYYYLAAERWQELSPHIADLDEHSEVIDKARSSLSALADQGNLDAKFYLGKMAFKKNNFREFEGRFLDETLCETIQEKVRFAEWVDTVKAYISLGKDEEKHKGYQALVAAYKKDKKAVFEFLLREFKRVYTNRTSEDFTAENSFFTAITRLLSPSEHEIAHLIGEEGKISFYHLMKHQFYLEFSKIVRDSEESKNFSEMAKHYQQLAEDNKDPIAINQ